MSPGHHLSFFKMNPSYCFSYEDFQTELTNAQEAHLRAHRQFRKLVRATQQVFRTTRCEVQMPLAGPLVLRAYFTHRHHVPAWSLVRCMARDFLYDIPEGFLASTDLDYWTPDTEPEYFFEVCLELPLYLPN
ncbi:hypothetical protein ABIB44_000850 [Hymenobacter sp. UYCo722]